MDPVLLFALVFTGLIIFTLIYGVYAYVIWERLRHWVWWTPLLALPLMLFVYAYAVGWTITMLVNR